MSSFGNYMEKIILHQLKKKYSNFKHKKPYSVIHEEEDIKILEYKECGTGFTVRFTIPKNNKEVIVTESYTYKTLLKAASNLNWRYEYGGY